MAVSVLASPALVNLSASTAIGGIAAPAVTNRNQTSGGIVPLGTEPSVFVQFSAFVRDLLAQQASDPGQDIDEALARNLSGLAQAASPTGQLYTATGLLQQYTTSLLLSQLNNTAANGTQALNDIADAARQAALNTELSALDQTGETDQPVLAASNDAGASTASPNNAATTAAPAEAVDVNVLAVAADTTTPPADAVPVTTEVTAQPDNTANTAPVPTAAPAPTGATVQLLSDNLDPYQQAALISGLTSFGKELNTFVPAATDPTLDSPIGPVAPITPIKPRSDVPEDAQASTTG